VASGGDFEGGAMGLAQRRARGVSRRELLRLGAIGIGIVSLGAACAPTPPAQPTAAPAAKPTTVAAAQSTTAAATVKPRGSITIALEAEADTIVPKDATTDDALFVLANVYSALTYRQFDQLGQPPKIVPHLAESFSQSQTDPRTWRFKLRQGIKYHNGEPFNADAVTTMVGSVVDPAKLGTAIDEFGLSGASATKVDDYTVDITTKTPDAILPNRLAIMGIPAPGWLRTIPKDGATTEAIGTGPYKLAEYQRASHFLLRANEDYWGPTKPTIGEIRIVFRNEEAVRASMLRAGEVQLATLVTPEDAKQLPGMFVEQTGESVGLRINTAHPILKDVRVRQALNLSIDRDTMIKTLYADVGEHLNGQMVRKSSLGWNPNLKEYPYDPDKAKQLMQEAGGVGQTIELISRNGVFPRVGEVNEFVGDQMSQTGLKVSVKSLEIGQWRTILHQVKPGDAVADLFEGSLSDPVLDSSRVMITYFTCGGVSATWCDQAFTDKLNTVLGLSGDARAKGFQELWATAYDQNVWIPLFGLNFVHGISPKLHWNKPRQDLLRLFNEWTLDA
jgi:peptide/nickel transport system substrate-binding protein